MAGYSAQEARARNKDTRAHLRKQNKKVRSDRRDGKIGPLEVQAAHQRNLNEAYQEIGHTRANRSGKAGEYNRATLKHPNAHAAAMGAASGAVWGGVAKKYGKLSGKQSAIIGAGSAVASGGTTLLSAHTHDGPIHQQRVGAGYAHGRVSRRIPSQHTTRRDK